MGGVTVAKHLERLVRFVPGVSGYQDRENARATDKQVRMRLVGELRRLIRSLEDDKERIAAWFLDSDYDGRTFCICQAFFPDKKKWDKLAKALGDADVIEEDAFDALSGLTSLPFPRPERLGKGESWRVAVKVIDPRGNEGMRVIHMSGRY